MYFREFNPSPAFISNPQRHFSNVYIPTTLKINHSNHKINRYILSSTHRIHTRDATPLQRVVARLILLQPPFQILQFLRRHSLKKKTSYHNQGEGEN